MNNKCLFLTILSPVKSKIMAPADSASSEIPLPGSSVAVFLLGTHMVAQERELFGVSFIGGVILLPPSFEKGDKT